MQNKIYRDFFQNYEKGKYTRKKKTIKANTKGVIV